MKRERDIRHKSRGVEREREREKEKGEGYFRYFMCSFVHPKTYGYGYASGRVGYEVAFS